MNFSSTEKSLSVIVFSLIGCEHAAKSTTTQPTRHTSRFTFPTDTPLRPDRPGPFQRDSFDCSLTSNYCSFYDTSSGRLLWFNFVLLTSFLSDGLTCKRTETPRVNRARNRTDRLRMNRKGKHVNARTAALRVMH